MKVIGSILHDFYTCIEKIFRNIAVNIDKSLPSGSARHSSLLERMSLNIPSVRKQIITKDLMNSLYDYLRFRHIFRNVYGFELNWDKISHLVMSIENMYDEFNIQILKFLDFLDEIDNNI